MDFDHLFFNAVKGLHKAIFLGFMIKLIYISQWSLTGRRLHRVAILVKNLCDYFQCEFGHGKFLSKRWTDI